MINISISLISNAILRFNAQRNLHKLGSAALQRQRIYVNQRELAQKLKNTFRISDDEVKLIKQNKAIFRVPTERISANIEFLKEKNIPGKSIVENPWLLQLSFGKQHLLRSNRYLGNNQCS